MENFMATLKDRPEVVREGATSQWSHTPVKA